VTRVLVTGHLGYIGTSLVPRLLAEAYDVTGCDPDFYRNCSFGAEPVQVPNLLKDVRDLQQDDLAGFDAVIHLAGLSNDPLGELNPRLTDEINYRATERVARLARDAGIQRFVFSSSCSSYGAAGEEFIDENGVLNPVTAYGRSKVDAEQALSKLACEAFSPTYLRNATVYGYSPRIRFDLVINNLVAWAYTTNRVLLKSLGLAWRPLVHVADVTDAFIATLKAPRAQIHDQAFNIGLTEENFRVNELAKMVVAEIPGTVLDIADGAEADRRTYRVNCDKAQTILKHWQPRQRVNSSIQELSRIYREHDLRRDDFEGPQFQRVAHLKHLIKTGVVDAELRLPRLS